MPSPTRSVETVELPNVMRRDLLPTVTQMLSEPIRKLVGTSAASPTYILCSKSLAPPELLPVCVTITCDRARKRWSNVRALARMHDVPFIFTINGQAAAVFYRHPDHHDDLVQSWLAEHQEKVRIAQLESQQPVSADTAVAQRLADLERRVTALEKGQHHDR